MAMRLLTWNYKTPLSLISCGIDAERIERFKPYIVNDDHPMPFVFSRDEIAYISRLSDPTKGFCSAFCCKEALYKAISKDFNFPDCQLFLTENNNWHSLRLSDEFRNQYGINKAEAYIEFITFQSYVECLAAVYVFK